MSANKGDVAHDWRGIVVQRDLDAGRPERSTGRTSEAESDKGRLSEGRVAEGGFTAGYFGRRPESRLAPLGGSSLTSLPAPRSQTHGPACTCVSCANQRMEKLNRILTDDNPPALHRKIRLDSAVRQATWPVMWTILGVVISIFLLPLTPGPVHGWVDSIQHTLSGSAVEVPAILAGESGLPVVETPTLASDAENVVRAYISSLNAFDTVGILSHVTEPFRTSAQDQIFIAQGLGT